MQNETAVLRNGLNGKTAAVQFKTAHGRTVAVVEKNQSGNEQPGKVSHNAQQQPPAEEPKFSTTEAAEMKQTQKAEQTPKKKLPKKKETTETDAKILKFVSGLDHPATSNEVRDEFGFKLRAPARAAFRRLEALGKGRRKKTNNHWIFLVKGKEYPAQSKSERAEKSAKIPDENAKNEGF